MLEEAGSSLQNVVKVQVFLTTMDNFAAMNTVYQKWFNDPKPVSTRNCLSLFPRRRRCVVVFFRDNLSKTRPFYIEPDLCRGQRAPDAYRCRDRMYRSSVSGNKMLSPALRWSILSLNSGADEGGLTPQQASAASSVTFIGDL